jgi:hypothetical protein
MTLRLGGRLPHLNTGVAHARRRVLAIADEQEVTIVALTQAKSSRATGSNPTRATGAINEETPADGRGP